MLLDRQHRERVRIHAAVQGTRSALREAPRQGPRDPGLPVQPVRRAGARQREGDRELLRGELRRDVSAVRQGRRQRRRRGAAVQVSQEARSRGCSAPRRSSGTSPSSWSTARATWSSATRRTPSRRASQATSRSCCEACRDAARCRVGRRRWSRWRSPAAPRRRWRSPIPNKVLRVAFPSPETGFDPQAAGDVYSNNVNRVIFDTLYRYDYLARPYKLVPNTAVGAAGDLGRRQDVDDPHQAGHLFRRRSRRSRASSAS